MIGCRLGVSFLDQRRLVAPSRLLSVPDRKSWEHHERGRRLAVRRHHPVFMMGRTVGVGVTIGGSHVHQVVHTGTIQFPSHDWSTVP